MMKWHLDQITGISSLSKRFGGIEDEDLLILLSRLKELEDAYSQIEKCCESVSDFVDSFASGLNSTMKSLASLAEAFPDCTQPVIMKAHTENTANEYSRFVKSKIDVEATELIINAVNDKRELLSELKKRISICERSCVSLKDMQIQLGQMKSSNPVDSSFQEEYQKLKIVVDQQKLQLQSDVHFLLEKDTPFVEQCIDIVSGMMQRSVAHTHSLFVKEPPKYLLDPSAPFVEGKEDSEIDFTVSTGGFHILPLSIKKGREIIWSIQVASGDLLFRLLYRDEKMNETIIEPSRRLSTGQGSYVGTGSGMLEMRFENDSFFRGKKVHVRLGVRDEVTECDECFCVLRNACCFGVAQSLSILHSNTYQHIPVS